MAGNVPKESYVLNTLMKQTKGKGKENKKSFIILVKKQVLYLQLKG